MSIRRTLPACNSDLIEGLLQENGAIMEALG
jgi:hypothetical protein